MKFARVINNIAIDVRAESPIGCFIESIASEFIEVPDNVEDGYILSNDIWEAPVRPEPVVVPTVTVYPAVGPVKFKMLFSSEERQKAKTLRATDATLDDFWELLDDCIKTNTEIDMSLESVQNAILYTLTKVKAAGVDLDVATRNTEILTGNPK